MANKALLTAAEREVVRASFLFRGASEETKASAAELAELRCYRRGEAVGEPGAEVEGLGILLSGRVEVTKSGAGYPMNVLLPGDVFGAAALFTERRSFVTRLTAVSADCRAAMLTEAALRELMRSDFAVAERYIEYLAGRIRFLNGKITGLIQQGSESTLRHWLRGSINGASPEPFAEVASFTRLASMLNMSRSSLYRSLAELEEAGIVRKEGKRIYVTDPALLVAGEE